MICNESLLVAVIKEIAVVPGKRRPDGTWAEVARLWYIKEALEASIKLTAAAVLPPWQKELAATVTLPSSPSKRSISRRR